MEILFFLSGIIAGIIAIKLGEFRSFCIFMSSTSLGRVYVSLGWVHLWFRIFTWILVAIFSVWFAGVIGFFIKIYINDLLGKFVFGALLILRWQISGILAMRKIQNKYPQIYKWIEKEKEIK